MFMDGGHNSLMQKQHWDYTIYAAHYFHFEHLLVDGAYVVIDDAGCPSHTTMKDFADHLVETGRVEHIENGSVDEANCYQVVLRKLPRNRFKQTMTS
jgi:hypothetical protein